MKTLIFEGAGWTGTKLNDVDNCRIRTRIKNRDNRLIYLELGGCKTNNYTPGNLKQFDVAAHIDHVFYEDRKDDKRLNYSKEFQFIQGPFEYTKANILKFVNEKLNCDFEDMVVNDDLRVHDTKKALCAA